MTNGEKFKTAKERSDAFEEFCELNKAKNQGCCDACCLCESEGFFCQFLWLEMEAEEEKQMKCPFCGERCESIEEKGKKKYEYAHRLASGEMSSFHDDEYVGELHYYRREVGEWEEVRDGK